MSTDEALRFLRLVAKRAESLSSEINRNPSAKKTARNVTVTFQTYERRLRALEIPPDMRGLGSIELDLID